ncbi:MAG: transglycosylase SLT domain-containing protein [Pseudomonadota bacterium]
MHRPLLIKQFAIVALLVVSAPLFAETIDTPSSLSDIRFEVASIDPQSPTLTIDDLIETINAEHQTQTAEKNPEVLSIEEVDVWERMRQGFGIPDLQNPLVANQLNWYTARPDYIARTTTRASRYLFHVLQELEIRGMPAELALLPFIESAFNPEALSSAKAAGMWQFIPSTGRDFNLKQNIFKDERRDVLASTDAALSYLQKLYGMFGDWHLALAAYNWGEGSVARAIKKNQAAGKPIDFNSLSALMPAETRNYVPKLQAVKNIIAHPEEYGLTLPAVENQPYFVTIDKTRDIDVKVAAQLAELSLDEFKALNPQFNRPVITGLTTRILLPHDNADKFKSNLAQWKRPLSSWAAHFVGKREHIEHIAKLFGIAADVLRAVNQIPPNMLISAGSTILVPKLTTARDEDIAPDWADKATMMFEREGPVMRRVTIKVGKKDSLASLAKRYKTSVEQLKSWNNLRRDIVSNGQALQVEVPVRATSGRRVVRLAQSSKLRQGKATVVQIKATGKAGKRRLS